MFGVVGGNGLLLWALVDVWGWYPFLGLDGFFRECWFCKKLVGAPITGNCTRLSRHSVYVDQSRNLGAGSGFSFGQAWCLGAG